MARTTRTDNYLETHAVQPLQGAALGLIVAGACMLLGLHTAFGLERPLALPIMAVLGAIIARWFMRPLAWSAIVLSLLAAIGIWSPLAPRLAQPFVRNDRASLDSVDAIFVLSGAVNGRGLIHGEALERMIAAMALRAGKPSLPLVFSNQYAAGSGTASQADQRALVRMVPATGSVLMIDSVTSTRDEAVRLSRQALLARWKRVAVVTSPTHTRRACSAIESLGVAVTCVAAPWRSIAWPARSTSDRLVVMQHVTYESLAWAKYLVTGWASW
jgi:uncharacterized SAM-binding protein YcdF (DUF218 family)